MDKIDTLIRELEEAPDGSRELSDKVLLESGWSYWANGYGPGNPRWSGGGLWLDPAGVGTVASDPRPSPTESLDAAAALVPERHGGNLAGFLHAAFWQGSIGDIPDDKLALALTIKVLKARRGA